MSNNDNRRYAAWMSLQSSEFILEVHPGFNIPVKFKLERPPITLKELQELDDKFINNSPEGGVNDGSTSD